MINQVNRSQVIKYFLAIFLPSSLVLAGIIAIPYYIETHSQQLELKVKEVGLVNHQKENIVSEFQTIISDLIISSGHHELPLLLENNKKESRDALAEEFLTFCKSKLIYDQIRLLDRKGLEVVRVKCNENLSGTIMKEELSLKKGRYYFQESFTLNEGDVYVSPFDLNVEGGIIEEPVKPTIRFGSPVYNNEGEKWGVVVINYLGAKMVKKLVRLSENSPGRLLMLNSDGFWLKGLKAEDEWGFMYEDGQDKKIKKSFPHAWQQISKNESGQFHDAKGMFTFTTVYPLKEDRKIRSKEASTSLSSLEFINKNHEYHWKIISYIPQEVLHVGSKLLFIGLILLYVVLALFLAIGVWMLAQEKVKQKNALKRIKKSEEGLAHAQQISHLGNWEWNIKTDKLYWSDEIYRIFGLSTKEFGANYEAFFNTIHPDDRAKVETAVDNALKNKNEYQIIHRIILPDDVIRVVVEQGEVAFDEMGNPVRMLGTVQDITEQHQLKMKMGKNIQNQDHLHNLLQIALEDISLEEQLNKAIDIILNIPWLQALPKAGIFLVASNKKILELKAHRGLFSESKEIDVTECIDDCHDIGCEGCSPHGNYHIPILLRGKAIGIVALNLKKGHQPDNSEVFFLETVANTLASLVRRKQMESDLIKAKEEAVEANKSKSDFLNTMSHELRTPLTVILGNLPMLADEDNLPDAEEIVEIAEDLEESGTHLLVLINDLLDISKIEAGKMTLNRDIIFIPSFIEGIIASIKLLVKQKGLNIKIDVADIDVYADAIRLKQIMLNLLSNAVKFTDTGVIEVKVSSYGEYVKFKVKDSGCGMKKEDLPHIFDVFRQVDGSSTRSASGTGLGLAITKKLVEMHGGNIIVDSVEGEGSMFEFFIPCDEYNNDAED